MLDLATKKFACLNSLVALLTIFALPGMAALTLALVFGGNAALISPHHLQKIVLGLLLHLFLVQLDAFYPLKPDRVVGGATRLGDLGLEPSYVAILSLVAHRSLDLASEVADDV